MKSISEQSLKRLPLYLGYLKSLPPDAPENISSAAIARSLGLGEVQVRKDLASVCSVGKPKIGYLSGELIAELEQFLGYRDSSNAILVGAGKLGSALASYDGFKAYGLNILAAFDSDSARAGKSIGKIPIMPLERLPSLCERMLIRIGIITVPSEHAQEVCDLMIASGILAVWNFAPVHLTVPAEVLVQNENMASSLAVLSKHLSQKING